MRPPAKKKAVAKKVAAKKAVRKPRGTASPQPRDATLAGRIVTAPQLVDPKAARARVTDWLARRPEAILPIGYFGASTGAATSAGSQALPSASEAQIEAMRSLRSSAVNGLRT